MSYVDKLRARNLIPLQYCREPDNILLLYKFKSGHNFVSATLHYVTQDLDSDNCEVYYLSL